MDITYNYLPNKVEHTLTITWNAQELVDILDLLQTKIPMLPVHNTVEEYLPQTDALARALSKSGAGFTYGE